MKKFLVGALLLFVFAITLPVLSYGQSCNIRKARGRSVNYSNAYYGYNNRRDNRRNYNRRNYRQSNERGYYQPAYYNSSPRRSYSNYNNNYGSRRPSFSNDGIFVFTRRATIANLPRCLNRFTRNRHSSLPMM